MLRNWFVFLYFPILLTASCGESEEPDLSTPETSWVDPLEGLSKRGRINFEQPQVGQRSIYLEFEENYDHSAGSATTTYTGDTLIVGVTRVNDDTIDLIEYYSRYSTVREIDADHSHLLISTQVVFNDSLFIMPSGAFSYLFTGYQFLPLTSDPDTLEEHTTTIPIYDLFSNVWMARIENYQVGEKRIDGLTGYFDYTATVTDGLGLSIVYSIDWGVVRSAYINPWEASKSEGWDLLIE